MMPTNVIQNMAKYTLIEKLRIVTLVLASASSIYFLASMIIIRLFESNYGFLYLNGFFMLGTMALITIHSVLKPSAIWPQAEKAKTIPLKVLIYAIFLKLCFSLALLNPSIPPETRSFMAKDIYLTVMLTLSLSQIFITSFGFTRLFKS